VLTHEEILFSVPIWYRKLHVNIKNIRFPFDFVSYENTWGFVEGNE
jgi:hypothetical protein